VSRSTCRESIAALSTGSRSLGGRPRQTRSRQRTCNHPTFEHFQKMHAALVAYDQRAGIHDALVRGARHGPIHGLPVYVDQHRGLRRENDSGRFVAHGWSGDRRALSVRAPLVISCGPRDLRLHFVRLRRVRQPRDG
jgi:hypothetical protein